MKPVVFYSKIAEHTENGEHIIGVKFFHGDGFAWKWTVRNFYENCAEVNAYESDRFFAECGIAIITSEWQAIPYTRSQNSYYKHYDLKNRETVFEPTREDNDNG